MPVTIHIVRGDASEATKALERYGISGAVGHWFEYTEAFLAGVIAALRGDLARARADVDQALASVRRWKTPLALSDCVMGLGIIAFHAGDPWRTCEMLAAVRAATGGGLRSPMSMTLYRHYVREVRRALDRDAIAAARAAGSALTLDDAIAREAHEAPRA
jgi:hypothetical protein